MPEVGQVVAGYRLEERLGAGAMGEVFAARRGLEPPVVIKFLESQLQDVRLRERFAREGAVLSRLPPHPALVRVHEYHGELDPPCLVMDFVPGGSLAERLVAKGPCEPREAARIARDVARGMALVHSQGLLHRDLKPANLLRTPAGQVRIVDFGLVKDVFATVLTAPDQLLGTGPYLAPECWSGAPPSPAVDVFALGVTLYELTCGARPFEGHTLDELHESVGDGDYVPLCERCPAPPELSAIVDQLLAGSLRFRYRSMAACRDDLERFLHDQPIERARLTDAAGRDLAPLGARLVLGSDARCDLVLPGADPQHAQIRRRPQGYELRDLRSQGGTFRGEERLERPAALRDGDRIRLGGAAEVVVADPRDRDGAEPFLATPARRVVTRERALALLALGDPRALALAAEWAAPDPGLAAEAARRLAALGPLPGLGEALAQEQGRWASWLVAQRAPDEWLRAWERAHAERREQWAPPAPPPELALEAVEGEPGWERLPLGEEELLLLGRDGKCHVRLRNRTVSRHHATLLRLQRTWLVRDEGRSVPVLLQGRPLRLARLRAGDALRLGDVELRLCASLAPPDRRVGPRVADALLALGHPACCALLCEELSAAEAESPEALGAALFPGDARQAQAAAERVAQARAQRHPRLRALLARHLGASPAAGAEQLRLALRAGLGSLGPQVSA